MRKKMYVFLLSLTMLEITGCTTEPSNSNITPTPTIEAKTKDITPTSTPTPAIETETKDSTGTPTPTKASSSAFLTDIKKKETITKTDGLCEELEKVDASLQAGYNSFNRMLSMDSELFLSGQSLFCVDESTGVIYFVNQGKDYYLYRIKDGEVKLAVAMPAKQIYTYQGSVYFMLDSYDMYELGELHSGDIYCYTPANGTVELIYEAGAIEHSEDHRLTVNESGIYFSYIIEEDGAIKIGYFYYLPFGETQPIKDTQQTTQKGWNDYVFSLNPNLILESRARKEDGTKETIELSARQIRFCVQGDYLYSAERTYISCLNLKTGEETKYDFLEAIQENNPQYVIEGKEYRIIESFTITETDIWAASGMILYRLNLETNELSYCRLCVDKNAKQPFYEIEELYTDGEQVYVTCLSYEVMKSKGVGCFARIKTDIVENIAGDDVMMLEILTK